MKALVLLTAICCMGCTALAVTAFQKQVGDERLIVVADNEGKNQRVISDPKEDTYHPDMGSEGRYVAYSRGKIIQGQDVSLEVVVKDLTSNVTEVWTPKGDQYVHVEFSGNGQYLAFSGPNPKNNKQNIFIIDLFKERALGPKYTNKTGLEVVQVYEPDYEIIESASDCYAPAVSSDGSLLVFHCTDERDNKQAPKWLMSYDRGSKTLAALTDKTKHAMFPSISATDQFIAYVSKDQGQWDIYALDLWTQKKYQITDDQEMEFTPSFRSDNDIYYTRFNMNPDGTALIDIYSVKKDITSSGKASVAKSFLSEKSADEYVISFSNELGLNKEIMSGFPLPERSSFGSVNHNGKVYIAGGHQGPEHTYPKESFLDVLQAYDPSTKTWANLAPMNEPKHGFQMAAYGNYIYVFGGFKFSANHTPGWQSDDLIERYDIVQNKWDILPVRLPRRRSSNALAVIDDKVYLIGGWDSTPKFKNDSGGIFHKEIDVFDLKTETALTLSTNLPAPLRRAFTAVTYKDKIYLLGGIGEGSGHFEWVDKLTVLDTKDMIWSEKAVMPFATFAPGAGIIDGQIYLTGGMIRRNINTFDLDYVDDIYVYDLNKDFWQHTGVYLSQNKGFPQVIQLSAQSLGILGGHTYQSTPKGVIDHPVNTFEMLIKNY